MIIPRCSTSVISIAHTQCLSVLLTDVGSLHAEHLVDRYLLDGLNPINAGMPEECKMVLVTSPEYSRYNVSLNGTFSDGYRCYVLIVLNQASVAMPRGRPCLLYT